MRNNKKVYKLSIWLLLVIPSSCQFPNGTANQFDQTRITPIEYNACNLIKDILKNLEFIINNSNTILKKNANKDECILALVDSLTNRAIKYQTDNYIVALDSICKASDGSISEYMNEVSEKLFYKDFLTFGNYLFKNKNNSCMKGALVAEMSMDLSVAEDDEKLLEKQQEINSFVNKQIKESKLSQEQIDYLYKLVKEFDPALVR